jgi:predicted phosphodiesterase
MPRHNEVDEEDSEGDYYSFDINNVHVLMFNSEYFIKRSIIEMRKYLEKEEKDKGRIEKKQKKIYEYIKKDLEANQTKVWKIVVMHSPLYVANPTNVNTLDYIIMLHKYGIEDLFIKYKVDLIISGHEHDYQRTRPIMYFNPLDMKTPLHDPNAPVYVIVGTGGNTIPAKNYDSWFKNKHAFFTNKGWSRELFETVLTNVVGVLDIEVTQHANHDQLVGNFIKLNSGPDNPDETDRFEIHKVHDNQYLAGIGVDDDNDDHHPHDPQTVKPIPSIGETTGHSYAEGYVMPEVRVNSQNLYGRIPYMPFEPTTSENQADWENEPSAPSKPHPQSEQSKLLEGELGVSGSRVPSPPMTTSSDLEQIGRDHPVSFIGHTGNAMASIDAGGENNNRQVVMIGQESQPQDETNKSTEDSTNQEQQGDNIEKQIVPQKAPSKEALLVLNRVGRKQNKDKKRNIRFN